MIRIGRLVPRSLWTDLEHGSLFRCIMKQSVEQDEV